MLLRLVPPRLQSAFPDVPIKLRGGAGFALPLLYEFNEFFEIEYTIGIPANCVFQQRAKPLQKRLNKRHRCTQVPQRSFHGGSGIAGMGRYSVQPETSGGSVLRSLTGESWKSLGGINRNTRRTERQPGA